MHTELRDFEVTVVGGGLAGMAASIHLARAGLRVACIEPDTQNADPVGESLDWSAPELLRELDLPMDKLLSDGIATYKRHVILKLVGGAARHYIPSDWLGRPPFNVELRTIHVDRTLLNRAVRDRLVMSGATFVRSRAVSVERDGSRVIAVVTDAGERLSSPWFLDASGSAASLFSRAFELPAFEYGPRKVALWNYFQVDEALEGTTLLGDCDADRYMEWMWKIPIHPKAISVGYVATGESIKLKRQQGLTTQEIYAEQLGKFEDLQLLRPDNPANSPRTTSYHCRAFDHISGPNWLVMGEAAAMVDPMTSYGVTGALRHAAEASRLVSKYRNRKRLPWLARSLYVLRVREMANFFNFGIERIIYEWPIRNRIGVLNAGDLYTIPAWSMNHLYSRFRPEGLISSLLFSLVLGVLRTALSAYYWFCRRSQPGASSCAT